MFKKYYLLLLVSLIPAVLYLFNLDYSPHFLTPSTRYKARKVVVINNTGEILRIYFEGPVTTNDKIWLSRTEIDLPKGKYTYHYTACRELHTGSLVVEDSGNKLILPDCRPPEGSVSLVIDNQANIKITLFIRGPAAYRFEIGRGEKVKKFVLAGQYQYSFDDCGRKVIGSFTATEKGGRVELNCRHVVADNHVLFTMINNTNGVIHLILEGNQKYVFTLYPGRNVLEIAEGKYRYTATGCGNATKTGTLYTIGGLSWTWICKK